MTHPSWQPPPAPRPRGDGAGAVVAIVAAVLGVMVLFGAVVGGVVAYMAFRSRATAMPVATSYSHTAPPSVAPTPGAWSDSDSPVPVTSNDPVRGDRTALVTIVVFSDFQCPFCKKLSTTLEDVRTRYSDAEVRIVWKHMPLAFHPQAQPAAEAAQGVFEVGGNAEFWQFHDRAFANQTMLGATQYDLWARDTGTDMTRWSKGVAAGDYARKVSEDVALGKALGASGTPTAFINGILLVGAQPLATYETKISAEIVQARAKLSAGVAPDRVYVERSKENFSAPPVPMYGKTLPSKGVATTDIVRGTGPMAITGDRLVVHYTGKLDDGTVFDTSRGRAPFEFELGSGKVIKGWDAGLGGMRVGGTRKLVIEPEAAYGIKGSPPTIPPNARLTFEVELIAIK